jgi:hypothetical protein
MNRVTAIEMGNVAYTTAFIASFALKHVLNDDFDLEDPHQGETLCGTVCMLHPYEHKNSFRHITPQKSLIA